MKGFILLLLLTASFNSFGQRTASGRYRDHFGSRLLLNTDGTFKYTWTFDLSSSWTNGKWKRNGDTIFLEMIPVYDTMKNYAGTADSLILSSDEKPERINKDELLLSLISSGGQNRMAYPEKLVFQKSRLYKIKNGKLIVKKQKDFWTNRKRDPWFFKSQD